MPRLVLPPLLLALIAAAPPPSSPGTGELQRLWKDHAATQARLTKQLEKIQAELEALEGKTTTRLLELVKKYPDDPGVFPALEQLLLDASPHATLALELITKHHLDHSRIGRLCLFLVEADEGLGRKTEALLRGAVAKSPHEDVRGQASLALARLLLARARTIERPDEARRLRQEAGAVLDTILKRYPNVRLPSTGEEDEGRRLGPIVRPLLFDLRRLALGQPVPELSGPDLDGKPLKLSDHRGKVVVLLFWSPASGASTELFPRMQALLKKPVAVVGVAEDEVPIPDDLRPGWRSFRNTRGKGPAIAAEWGLESWPAVFLIDAKGVIRRRWPGKPEPGELEKAVEALVRESGK